MEITVVIKPAKIEPTIRLHRRDHEYQGVHPTLSIPNRVRDLAACTVKPAVHNLLWPQRWWDTSYPRWCQHSRRNWISTNLHVSENEHLEDVLFLGFLSLTSPTSE